MTGATTPPDKTAFSDQTPLYNSGILGNYIHYLESHHVDVDIDELLGCSELTRFDINDGGHFLTQAQINRFHHCLDEALDDPEISYKVGQHALHMKSTGTIKQYELQFITPKAMYKAVDRLYPKWSKAHVSKTTITGKGRAEVTVSVRPGVREERFQCENRRGIFEAIGKMLTGQSPQVTHPRCMHHGDESCHYLISWREKPSAIWKRSGVYAGMLATAVSAATLFYMPAAFWIPSMLAMGMACLSILLFGSRLEKKELVNVLNAHGDSAGNLLEEIEARCHNARSYLRMQESEQRYRRLAENVTDVIWILDVETFKMTYVSPSVEKALDYTPDEMLTLSIDQYLTPDSFQRAATALGEAMERTATGEIDPESYSMTLELEAYHKNGTIIPIEVNAGFLVDENGKPNAVLGISRDLSDRKKSEIERTASEDKLQRAKKMESLGTMAGSIAHNFNNLLMVVLGNLELAKADLPEGSTAARNIQRAANASQRAADLSGMMLTYVGQLKKESIPVDLSQTVAAVLKNMDESKMANVTLDLDLADPMPLVTADADQMRQMISGFITNAIEALGKEKGRVRISSGSMHCDKNYLSTTYLKADMPEGMYAYVAVADTGCGMDTETLGKVFDPFFSTKFTGRGLGMAAVMGIIRSHDGAVTVSSVKNKGSVFTALFPIQGISLRPAEVKIRDDKTVAEGRTVLLVDDEAMVMDIGSQFLKRLGYSVRTASSGQEALDIFKQASDSIDCLLLDVSMPGMDGLETMRQIKKIRSDARILITSGYTRQQIEDQFTHVGLPDGFIHKPFEMKELQEILNKTISKAK